MNDTIDLLAIGDITTDAFIRLKEASVSCDINRKHCKISMDFASKVPYEFVEIVRGVGNSANAAVGGSRLGIKTALVAYIGDDENGKLCEHALKAENVGTDFFTVQANKETNYHYVLWYEDERTILVKHQDYRYRLPKMPAPKWVYLSSLGGGALNYHKEINEFLQKNPETKLAFQPGTFQLSLKLTEPIMPFYERAEVLVVNVEEAKKILTSEADIKSLLKALYALGPKIVLITDGPKGAYMYCGDKYWFMPIYPDPKPPYERTGAGDSFASTFVSALIYGKTPEEALIWAPINPMSVVQYIGAQKGLLNRPTLEKLLFTAPPDYHPIEMH